MSKPVSFKTLVNTWPSAFVAREEIERFTGGIINSKTLANLDSQKKGPRGRIRINNRKIAYPVDSVIEWLESRSTSVD
jgi:hypothetical protein